MVSLFPYISSDLLSQALTHPTYAGSPQPLVEAILAGGFNLPSELRELRALVMDHSGLGDQAEGSGTAANGNSNVKKVERRNIWQDEKIDLSRLKIKDHSYVHPNLTHLRRRLMTRDEAIATLGGAGIPNHLRDSIFRLVENQAIEAEEQERALAEARGEPSRSRRQYDDLDHDEEDVSRVRVVGEGDASGDEDIEGDADKIVDVSPLPWRERLI